MFKINVLIADDEVFARRKLFNFLRNNPAVDQVYEAADGQETVRFIREKQPGLILLDIQMPGLNGFEVIRQIGADQMPPVIFTTAYDRYALDAFEVHAIDYLLKPFDKERFDRSIENALVQIRREEQHAKIYEVLIQHLNDRPIFIDRLTVSVGRRYIFLPVADVYCCSSGDKYVEVFTENKSYLIRETLSHLEEILDPRSFVRIHRSHLVNLQYIREMYPRSHGDYTLVLQNGTKLVVSRRYRDRLFNSG